MHERTNHQPTGTPDQATAARSGDADSLDDLYDYAEVMVLAAMRDLAFFKHASATLTSADFHDPTNRDLFSRRLALGGHVPTTRPVLPQQRSRRFVDALVYRREHALTG